MYVCVCVCVCVCVDGWQKIAVFYKCIGVSFQSLVYVFGIMPWRYTKCFVALPTCGQKFDIFERLTD